ncbi:MAG: EAL domain-containing protein [Rhodocyclales bacterium]|nr:EAL domain-containing protein [Rhodocyclales bacterium]
MALPKPNLTIAPTAAEPGLAGAAGRRKHALRAGDCLCRHWMRVDAEQRYADVLAGPGHDARVFAVFDGGRGYLGLVEARDAALFPGRIFADLLVRRQPPALAADMALHAVFERLGGADCDYLPVVDGAGGFVGAISMLSGVTALLDQERQLRGEREQLIESLRAELENRRITAAVFDAASEGIVVTDADSRIILVNAAFTRTTGYSEGEVLGQTPGILRSGRHGAEFYDVMWRDLWDQGHWKGEIWNRRKDGKVYPEWLHINAVRDDAGSISYYAGVFSDIMLHEDLRNKLHNLAYYDPLTDLPNRQLFTDRLAQVVAQAQRAGSGFSVLFIDLDGFKDVNDTLGHSAGDRLLVSVAARLRAAVRQNDTVARLGGDEFTVILQESVDESAVVTAASKIFDALGSPFEIDGHDLFVGASIGASRYPDDGVTVEQLLIAADSAMYRAKGEGKGRLGFYSAILHQRATHRVETVSALRSALNQQGLRVHWQPQVNLADGTIGGIEALARWPRPDEEPISPAVFIPIAEQSGLIDALGLWVLETACAEAASLCDVGSGCFPRVAINFSPLQLKPGIERAVIDVVRVSGLDPAALELELTESALATGREGMLEFLRKIGETGIDVAVDDFGTGSSNLATLKTLPVQKVKIDRSFVCDMVSTPNDREIVAAIISMAHALNLKVVAEGVETHEQARILRDLGCDMAQGYLYSRPVPLADLRVLLAAPAHQIGAPTELVAG